ncbi:MAG: AMP-binding protein, partial [Candidatus Delongbacteria bacterium]|nr:AMP-binding protein [Candidatus Delongbacteria bacterium]
MVMHLEFIRTAKRFKDKIAIRDRSTNKDVTYSKALLASLILSHRFRDYKEGFIGIMIPTSAGAMLSILGCLMAGKVPVMINYSTGAASNAEYAQSKCGFKTIITSRALVEKIGCRLVNGMVFIEDIMKKIGWVDKIRAAIWSLLPLPILLHMVHRGEDRDNLVILFTSGSEKDPKAVQLTHRNISSNIEGISQALSYSSSDIMLANLPLFHVFGQNINFWLPLINGMTVVTYANPLEYRVICQIIREEKCSLMVGTPVFFAGYLRQAQLGDFTSIRIAVAGADKMPDNIRESFVEKHNLIILEGYGTTETSPVISTNSHNHIKLGSVGRPLPNVKVKIIDPDSGHELPSGHTGKILVKGDLVMPGYLDDLEETSYRLINGWYDTGDMGMLDEDGFLWHKGRLKRFIKIGGEMISLVKIENALEEILPEGVTCCVVEVPDSLKGAKIVAAVTESVNEK